MMRRYRFLALAVAVFATLCVTPTTLCVAQRSNATSEAAAQNVFPLRWKVGDHWQVSMSMEGPVNPIAMLNPPPYMISRVFTMRVMGVPDAHSRLYRIEARSKEEDVPGVYMLYYRKDTFTLAKVTSKRDGRAVENIFPDGVHRAANRFADDNYKGIILDFPLCQPYNSTQAETEYTINGTKVKQKLTPTPDGLLITMERDIGEDIERTTMHWKAHDPWWSDMQRVLPGVPHTTLKETVLAFGHLLREQTAGK